MTRLEKQAAMRARQENRRRGRPPNIPIPPEAPRSLVREGRCRLKCYLLWMAGKGPAYLSHVMERDLGRKVSVEAVNLWLKLGAPLRPVRQVLADRDSIQRPMPAITSSGNASDSGKPQVILTPATEDSTTGE
jgi:hypothetical protein